MELECSLAFACDSCGLGIEARVHCAGPGLSDRTRPVAAVLLSCPHCGQDNQVLFEPKTTVIRAVRPAPPHYAAAQPSAN